jgi:hypothetical protein
MKIFAADSEILCPFASYLQDGNQTIGYLLHVFQNKITDLKEFCDSHKFFGEVTEDTSYLLSLM